MLKNTVFAKLILLLAIFSASVKAEEVKALIKTSLGDITVELYPEKAPLSVKNFTQYVEQDFYKGVIFHRVIAGFMAQTGGFDENMQKQKTAKPIKNESYNGLSNERGTLALARTNNPDSATSQFFINLKDNKFLDRSGNSPSQAGYAVFGRVTKGMDVVDKMAQKPTGRRQYYSDVPMTNIVIENITLLN